MKKKILETSVAVITGVVVLAVGFWLGWASGTNHPKSVQVTGVANMFGDSSTTAPADFTVFWQAWQDINDLYLRNPSTTPQEKIQGAMSGLVSSLGDPYTDYFPPAANQQFQQDISGHFGGIGAELGIDAQNHLAVIAPLAGTPAAAAGIKAGDEILQINSSSTDTMSVDDAVSAIRGPIGTPVTLSILRSGSTKPQDFKIIRADIQVPTADFKMHGDVAVIGLHEFTENADYLVYQELVKAEAENAKGIILDLRNDPGGYLEVAVNIAGYFVKPGSLIVKEVGRSVPEQDYTSTGSGSLATMPLVILVNGGSASASEILAGTMHDVRGTKLVGTQSFGKGTVQQLEQLADGSSIKITIAHWVLPSGRIIDHEGLTPDYVVSSTDAQAVSGTDSQLDKALQVINGQIGQ